MICFIRSVINIRYAQIRNMDVSNGESVGCALFVQGCSFHCKNCFNKDTWDFAGGKEWTDEIEGEFLKLIDRPYIKRISILGGEPLADENVSDVLRLVNKIRFLFPNKSIWLFTGYTWEDIIYSRMPKPPHHTGKEFLLWNQRNEIISMIDVLVDGRFEEDKKDLALAFRGSSNQRIINVKESLKQKEIVLWTN